MQTMGDTKLWLSWDSMHFGLLQREVHMPSVHQKCLVGKNILHNAGGMTRSPASGIVTTLAVLFSVLAKAPLSVCWVISKGRLDLNYRWGILKHGWLGTTCTQMALCALPQQFLDAAWCCRDGAVADVFTQITGQSRICRFRLALRWVW